MRSPWVKEREKAIRFALERDARVLAVCEWGTFYKDDRSKVAMEAYEDLLEHVRNLETIIAGEE